MSHAVGPAQPGGVLWASGEDLDVCLRIEAVRNADEPDLGFTYRHDDVVIDS
jgi:hypothetical protein